MLKDDDNEYEDGAQEGIQDPVEREEIPFARDNEGYNDQGEAEDHLNRSRPLDENDDPIDQYGDDSDIYDVLPSNTGQNIRDTHGVVTLLRWHPLIAPPFLRDPRHAPGGCSPHS